MPCVLSNLVPSQDRKVPFNIFANSLLLISVSCVSETIDVKCMLSKVPCICCAFCQCFQVSTKDIDI